MENRETLNYKIMDKRVQEIHDAFNGASDNLLVEAQEYEQSISNITEEQREAAKKLNEIGFSNVESISKTVNADSNLKQKKAAAELVIKKRQIDPIHKFITNGKARDLCEKYGLVKGTPKSYIGKIPNKNMMEIASFKCVDPPGLVLGWIQHSESDTLSTVRNAIKKGYDIKLEHIIDRDDDGTTYEYYRWEMSEDAARKTGFDRFIKDEVGKWKICAPPDHFNMKDYQVKNGMVVPVNDPIVLYEVDGGYRIVTAWGPEAEDEDVMNPINN